MNDWNDAERRVERAQELFEQRKWQEALEELRAATSINPYNSGWYFNIGLTLDEMGRLDEAVEAYKQALAIDPNDLQAMNHLGVDLHRVGQLEQALETFQKIETVDPAFEPAYCNRIITYTDLNDHEKAEEMFYLARLYKEHCPHCYYNIGVSLAARRSYDKAIFCWQKTLDLDELHPEVHLRIAEAMWSKGELEQARRHYLSGLRQDPGSTETLLDLGELLTDMGRVTEAGEKFRRAIELAPDEPAGHYFHGKWLMQSGLEDEAAAASFMKALRLDPTFPGAHLHLAKIHFRRREVIEARSHLRGEILLRPQDTAVLMELSNLLMDTGDSRPAVACLKRLVQLDASNVNAWINLAVASFMRCRYDDGIDACRAALEVDHANLLAMYNLALAHEHLGRFDEAMSWVRRGLKREPNDASFQKLEFRLRVLKLRAGVVRVIRKSLGMRAR
ncbi:MAG: tetratricopeptide repeat protein [Tepidisphaeraceae bacterium]